MSHIKGDTACLCLSPLKGFPAVPCRELSIGVPAKGKDFLPWKRFHLRIDCDSSDASREVKIALLCDFARDFTT